MSSKSKMIALEMAERVFGIFPSSLVGTDGTETPTESVLLVDTKEHSEHLAGSALVVLAGLVTRHVASQGLS